MASASLSSFRPPQWVSVLALASAATTFIWSMVTLAPPSIEDSSRYARDVRELYASGEWSSAVDLSRVHLEEEPGSFQGRFFLAMALERREFEGDAFEARQVWVDLRNLTRSDHDASERATPAAQAEIRASVGYFGGWAHHKLGEFDEARSRWEEAATLYERAARDSNRGIDYYIYSNVLALLGKPERALDAWYQAVERGYSDLRWVAADPDLVELRSHPQFDLVRRAASGRVDRVARELYAEGVASGSMRKLTDLLDRHLRYQPRDQEALLFRAFADEASGADAASAWTDLDVAARASASDEMAIESDSRPFTMSGLNAGSDPGEGSEVEPETGPGESRSVLSDDPVQASSAGVSEATLYHLAWAARGLGDLERSRAIFAFLARTREDPDRQRAVGLFNIACYSAMAGQIDRAWHALARTRFGGTLDRAWVAVDPDLAALQPDPRFEALLSAETFEARVAIFGEAMFASDEFGALSAFGTGFGVPSTGGEPASGAGTASEADGSDGAGAAEPIEGTPEGIFQPTQEPTPGDGTSSP